LPGTSEGWRPQEWISAAAKLRTSDTMISMVEAISSAFGQEPIVFRR
jgi:hypothetical protein